MSFEFWCVGQILDTLSVMWFSNKLSSVQFFKLRDQLQIFVSDAITYKRQMDNSVSRTQSRKQHLHILYMITFQTTRAALKVVSVMLPPVIFVSLIPNIVSFFIPERLSTEASLISVSFIFKLVILDQSFEHFGCLIVNHITSQNEVIDFNHFETPKLLHYRV